MALRRLGRRHAHSVVAVVTPTELRELARAAATKLVDHREDQTGAAPWVELYDHHINDIADAAVAAIEGAVRASALEEAARVCDEHAKELDEAIGKCSPLDYDVIESLADCAVGSRECAARIEALAARGAKP